jgi:hypothetical protein
MPRIETLRRWEIRFWFLRIRINELPHAIIKRKAFTAAKPEGSSGIPQTITKGDPHEKE